MHRSGARTPEANTGQLYLSVRSGSSRDVAKSLENASQASHILNYFDTDGRTAVSIAAGSGYAEKLQMLMEAKADIDKPDKRGKTPLFYAVENDHPASVNLLLERGADPRKENNFGESPWALAKRMESQTCAQVIENHLAHDTCSFCRHLISLIF